MGELTTLSRFALAAVCAGALLAETARPDEVRMIRDIADQDADADPNYLTVANDLLFFTADDGVSGAELWVSDGSAEGTRLLKDIEPGEDGSSPLWMVSYKDAVYFFASTPELGREFYTSDGTEEGTVLVKDLLPMDNSNRQHHIPIIVNDLMFFHGHDEALGEVIWRSDGTEEGTTVFFDLSPDGSDEIYSPYLTQSGGAIYFAANDGTHGEELWITDGTEGGTRMVADIVAGETSGFPYPHAGHNGMLFFGALDPDFGYEPWFTDGSEGGTRMLADLAPGAANSNAGNAYFAPDGTLYCMANDNALGSEPYIADPGGLNFRLLKDINPEAGASNPGEFFAFGEQIFFRANDGTHATEMWATDGTPEGTVMFRDVESISGTFALPVLLGDTLIFTAQNADTGLEPFRTDGTLEGTSLILDINPGLGRGYDGSPVPFQDAIFFRGNDGANGSSLWRTDGTPGGTQMVIKISTISTSSDPRSLTPLGSRVVFAANDGVNGESLWISDGTEEGTALLRDIGGSGNARIDEMTPFGEKIIFVAQEPGTGRELFATDGTEGGTVILKDIVEGSEGSIPSQLTAADNHVFFVTRDEPNGGALWRTDGTPEGTEIVRDVNPATDDDGVSELTAAGPNVFFAGYDLGNGQELWFSDGTFEGTVPVAQLAPGPESRVPFNLTWADGLLFFSALNTPLSKGIDSRSLWVSDGTAEGTVAVADINPGGDARMSAFHAVGNIVYFVADDGEHGEELWRSDGTPEGTWMVKDIWIGPGGSFINEIIDIGGRLYFAAGAQDTSLELWTSDGTTNGTRLAADILPEGGSDPEQIINVNGVLYFTAEHPDFGREIWKSYGSEAGTFMLPEIREGALDSTIRELTAAGENLYFQAADGQNGTELWGAFTELETSFIRRADADPTQADTLHFDVGFNRPVSGVDITDFAIDAQGIDGAAIESVEDLGAFFRVTVGSGTGDGTLSLDLVDDDSIVEIGGGPLGGEGAGNGDFTFGEFYTLDTAAPSITVDQLFTMFTGPGLTGAVDDPDATVTITIEGETRTALNQRDGTWFLVGGLFEPFAEGVYDVIATATDLVGNSATDTVTDDLYVDQTPPLITVDSVASPDASPAFTGTINEATSEIRISLLNDTALAVNNGDGTWTLAADALSVEAEGHYDVRATAFDRAGNEGMDDTTIEYLFDATPPTVTLLGDAEITLAAGVDTYLEAGISIVDGGDPLAQLVIEGEVDDNTPGVYTLTYYAVDRAGNESERLERTVTVTAPAEGEGEGEGEGEPEPSVCDDTDAVITQGDFFRGVVLGESDNTDLDEDGVPDFFAIGLFLNVVCNGTDAEIRDAARAAFNANRAKVVLEPVFAQLSAQADAFAVYMSISAAMRTVISEKLDARFGAALQQDYEIALPGMAGFSGEHDLDGDGATNAEEAANLIARELGYQSYAEVALDPNDIGMGPGVGVGEGEGEGEGEPSLSVASARQLESNFAAADANDDDQLTLEEARTVLPGLTQGQFGLLDGNNNGFVTLAEIRAFIDANTEAPGGCNAKALGADAIKKHLGDLFMLGLALGALGLARRSWVGLGNL